MAQQVVLHVGAMKSGTSYLQRLLAANREVLAERGVCFAGGSWKAQVRGVAEVLERKRLAVAPEPGAWQALVDELDAWPGQGVISMEFLGPAGPTKVEKVVSSFAPGTVDVVVTARDLSRNVPAMWQETIKNGRAHTFADYVASIADDEGPPAGFWREQGIARMCRKWAQAVGPDRVTLVTVPRPGAAPDELWRRFAEAVGWDPAGVEQPGPANESLGAASAEVLRRLNGLLEGLDFADYAPLVKHQVAKQVLAGRRADEPAVGFDPPPWLAERSRRMVERLQQTGVRVVGDLADLDPVPVPGVDPGTVPADDQLAAAVAALEGLVRLHAAGDLPRSSGQRRRRAARRRTGPA